MLLHCHKIFANIEETSMPGKRSCHLIEVMLSNVSGSSLNVVTYRSGTVNSKSFVGKVVLRIKWKFELINAL